MSTEPKPHLDRIDLSRNSRDVLAVLVKLLAPHVPSSLQILGTMLNSNLRSNTLQDVDPSKVCLWSTIPLHPGAVSTTGLFSIVTYSHPNTQFSIFCSSDSSTSSDPPTEAEKAHMRHVFEYIRNTAREARPLYDADLTPTFRRTFGVVDTPVIAFAAIHSKWAEVLAPMCAGHGPFVRYVSPPGPLARDDVHPETQTAEGDQMELSEIQMSDLPFVHGASRASRSDAYLLSRAPYSVCLRLRADRELGQPVACALMHADGSIGALRVDQENQRHGLGKLVLRALMEKLDFSKGQCDAGLISDEYRDPGGGALGWNWIDTGAQNEAANHLFTSVVGKGKSLSSHWACMSID